MRFADKASFSRLWATVTGWSSAHSRQYSLSLLSKETLAAGHRLASARRQEERLRRLSSSFARKTAVADWESACRQLESAAEAYEAALDRLLQARSLRARRSWANGHFLRHALGYARLAR
jgi:hypothetical protein